MHQTTVRFAPDLWAALEFESEQLGVSIAQFVRDAAVTRLAFADGLEHGRGFSKHTARAVADKAPRLARAMEDQLSDIEAVRAQGQLARDRAKRLRADAQTVRARALTRAG